MNENWLRQTALGWTEDAARNNCYCKIAIYNNASHYSIATDSCSASRNETARQNLIACCENKVNLPIM